MRITPEQRQMLNRRNLDRLPAAVRASSKGWPALVIVVTTTLFVSPEAWARVQEGKARAMVVTTERPSEAGENAFVKHYTKDELKEQIPANPVVGFDERIAVELTGVINRVGKNMGGKDQREAFDKARTTDPTADQWRVQAAAMADAPEQRKANVEGMRSLLATESQKAATTTAKSKFDLVGKLGGGFKFNLDLKSWFSGDKSGKQTATNAAAAKGGNIRYGLIVEDIVPDLKAPKRAAVGNDQELEYAGHAEVKWTIGPIEEAATRRMFEPVSQDGLSGKSTSAGGLKIPSPNFSGTLTPENLENFAKVDKENMPAWRLDLAQEDGLYSMAYRTKTNGERISVEHMFKLPIAGTIELGRRFSDNFDVVQTSIYNILYDKRMPLLSVHYMDVQQRYMADLTKTFGSHSVGVAARGKAKNTEGLKSDEVNENYTINYTNQF